MTGLRALVLDCDGTLADTERDGHRVAYNDAFAEAGLPWHLDEPTYEALRLSAGGRTRLLRHWLARAPVGVGAAERDALAERLGQRERVHYETRILRGDVPLRPGIARLIAEARREGLSLAVATRARRALVTALLEHGLGSGATGWFDVLATGDEVAAAKPDPAVYRFVLAALRITPREALAVEDSASGLAAARAAGIACLVTPTTSGATFAGALRVVASLERHPERHATPVGLADLRAWWSESEAALPAR